MSLTQVHFFILPGSCLISNDRNNLKVDGEGLFEDDVFWRESKTSSDAFLPVEHILRKSSSWSKNIVLYGSQKSNRLEVCIEEDFVVSASFRIDFTVDYEHILRSLLEFFILNGFVILDDNLNLLPLNIEAVNGVIVNATQYRFYQNLLDDNVRK